MSKKFEEEITKEVFSGEEFNKEYELYQSYERFHVYDVYKKKKDGQREFLYRETKDRYNERRCTNE